MSLVLPFFLPCSGRPSFSFPLPSSSSDLCKQNSCRRLHSHFTLMWCYTTMMSADILTHQQAAASYQKFWEEGSIPSSIPASYVLLCLDQIASYSYTLGQQLPTSISIRLPGREGEGGGGRAGWQVSMRAIQSK